MKSKKKLQEIFNKSKGSNPYITFEVFEWEAKKYVKLLKTTNTICSMYVSKSGMMRTFNFSNGLNIVFNICYLGKRTHDAVRVSGCGIDMHWYLKFCTAETLMTKAELEKWNINSRCSSGQVL